MLHWSRCENKQTICFDVLKIRFHHVFIKTGDQEKLHICKYILFVFVLPKSIRTAVVPYTPNWLYNTEQEEYSFYFKTSYETNHDEARPVFMSTCFCFTPNFYNYPQSSGYIYLHWVSSSRKCLWPNVAKTKAALKQRNFPKHYMWFPALCPALCPAFQPRMHAAVKYSRANNILLI